MIQRIGKICEIMTIDAINKAIIEKSALSQTADLKRTLSSNIIIKQDIQLLSP